MLKSTAKYMILPGLTACLTFIINWTAGPDAAVMFLLLLLLIAPVACLTYIALFLRERAATPASTAQPAQAHVPPPAPPDQLELPPHLPPNPVRAQTIDWTPTHDDQARHDPRTYFSTDDLHLSDEPLPDLAGDPDHPYPWRRTDQPQAPWDTAPPPPTQPATDNLLPRRAPAADEAAMIRDIFAETGSLNATIRRVYGTKDAKTHGWVKAALDDG